MKKLKLLAVFLTVLMLSGCWDKIEIEDRLFVLGIGIDKATEEEKKHPDDRYMLSFASPIVGALKDGGGETFKTYKTPASIFTSGLNQLYERFDKKLSFHHTRVIIFGEDLLKDDQMFRELLDAIGRSHDFHRSMYIFAVPGKAADVFEVKPPFSKLLATYITGIAENSKFHSSIYKMPAYEFYDNVINLEGDTIIPTLLPGKEEVKVAGVGIIKDYKLAGYFDDRESEALNWLNNSASSGIVVGKHEGIEIPYMYNDFTTEMKLDKVEGDKLYISYNMESEGSVGEYIWDKALMDQVLLEELQKQLNKTIETRSKGVVEKLQKEFKVDLVGVGEFLRKHHPAIYKSIEKDYENYFANHVVIDVKAKTTIRRVGTIE